jgi:drug/metabolite transporter (DMT)-like permease
MQKNKLKSLLHFHFIVFIFGFTAILGSLISIDSISLVWYRMAIAFLTLLFLSILLKKNIILNRFLVLKMIFAGVLIALHWITFFKAIKLSNVSVTLSVLSLGAFLTSFLEPLFYKRKIIKYEVILGIMAVIGMSLIFKSQYHFFEGNYICFYFSNVKRCFCFIKW